MSCINYFYHQSVLLKEAIRMLNIYPSGLYIDGTFGLGGHSKLILSKLSKNGFLLGIDKDLSAVRIGNFIAAKDHRFAIVHGTFSKIKKYVQGKGFLHSVNGILLDLGISSLQLNDVTRGFSFMQDGPLDMRMDISKGQSASDWLSKASQTEICWVLKNFGEEKFAKKIARAIVEKRQKNPILRSCVLSKLISSVIPYREIYKHPATRSFLAIRMYINSELKELIQILQDSLEILSINGRLVIISFNSLEDRLVKCFIKKHSSISIPHKMPLTEIQIFNECKKNNECQLKNIGKIMPSSAEIKENIRARSAVLRCAEKSFRYD